MRAAPSSVVSRSEITVVLVPEKPIARVDVISPMRGGATVRGQPRRVAGVAYGPASHASVSRRSAEC